MTDPDNDAVGRIVRNAGLGAVRALVPLTGGKNNRVYRVEAENGEAVLKSYFRHPDDPRDRLGAEWAFSKFAAACGANRTPEPLSAVPETGLALFELLAGRRPTAADVTDDTVAQATDFVEALNAARWRPLGTRLPVASEACFSLAEHLGTVARRVDRLVNIADPEAAAFVRRELVPAWASVRAEACSRGLPLGRPLDPTERCVTPSDFGFHNALIGADRRVRFLDFEYAGWDDPAKLVCDFFCQPAVPVPERHLEVLAHAIAMYFPRPATVIARVRALLPVYRLKWVCIRLNDFLPADGRRRAFALPAADAADRRNTQLAAARAALHQHQGAAA